MNNINLIREAFAAREHAYAPYSNFMVGTALLTKNGKIYRGCNIENSAYSTTNCAERTALFTAICAGEHEFEAIAIVGGLRNTKNFAFCYPCGVCRQVLSEFCSPEMSIIVAHSETNYQTHTLNELLPHSFDLIKKEISPCECMI